MKTEFVITSDKDYQETMVIIYDLMNKGEEKLTDNEILKLEEFALATENYEDEVLHLKLTKR